MRRADAASDAGERADGVQAVEEEVWIDLRAQHPQLGFARKHLHLQRLSLRGPRMLDNGDQIADRQRQQIQQHAERRVQRVEAGGGAKRRNETPSREPVHPRARGEQPHGARDGRSRHGGRDDTESAGRRERHPLDTYHAERHTNA